MHYPSLFLLCVLSSQSLLPAFRPNPINKAHVGTSLLWRGDAATWTCLPGHEVQGSWSPSCVPLHGATCAGSSWCGGREVLSIVSIFASVSKPGVRSTSGGTDAIFQEVGRGFHMSLCIPDERRWSLFPVWILFCGRAATRQLGHGPPAMQCGNVTDALAPVLWRKL